MAIPFKYNYYDDYMNQVYPAYDYIQYPYGFINNPRVRFVNFSNNVDKSFPKEEYFEDTDITVIYCCKDLAKEFSPFVNSINYAIIIADKYISAILSDDYKMSIYDFYNEEIKKGLLTYITNIFRNYPVFSDKKLDKIMFEMLLQMIRNGYSLKIKAKKFDKYIEFANENNFAQDIAELLEFRHKHYGNYIDVSKFDL